MAAHGHGSAVTASARAGARPRAPATEPAAWRRCTAEQERIPTEHLGGDVGAMGNLTGGGGG
jgi:hypothetical protein